MNRFGQYGKKTKLMKKKLEKFKIHCYHKIVTVCLQCSFTKHNGHCWNHRNTWVRNNNSNNWMSGWHQLPGSFFSVGIHPVYRSGHKNCIIFIPWLLLMYVGLESLFVLYLGLNQSHVSAWTTWTLCGLISGRSVFFCSTVLFSLIFGPNRSPGRQRMVDMITLT